MGRITLEGLEVFAHHGVGERERREGQRFLIDVTLELDLRPAAASDDLDDTVDYSGLAGRIAEVATGGPWLLLETVADRVAGVCLEDARVGAVEVVVHKPDVALPAPVRDVRVSLRRTSSQRRDRPDVR